MQKKKGEKKKPVTGEWNQGWPELSMGKNKVSKKLSRKAATLKNLSLDACSHEGFKNLT